MVVSSSGGPINPLTYHAFKILCVTTILILKVLRHDRDLCKVDLTESHKRHLIQVLSDIVMQPTYCRLHATQVIRYIMNLELQFINPCILNCLPVAEEVKFFPVTTCLHALQISWSRQ